MSIFVYIEWIIEFLSPQENKIFLFDWDEGNSLKSFIKHGIDNFQIESSFQNPNMFILGIQISPFVNEERYAILGIDFKGNLLFVSFTIREGNIRIISGRKAHKKERRLYGKTIR